jgi:hypothetical protein
MARSFAVKPIEGRISSSHRKRTSDAMRATTVSSLPFSTNIRLDTTVCTQAARHADSIASAPAEKFSMHGTLPNAWRPANATSVALAFGSMMPTNF